MQLFSSGDYFGSDTTVLTEHITEEINATDLNRKNHKDNEKEKQTTGNEKTLQSNEDNIQGSKISEKSDATIYRKQNWKRSKPKISIAIFVALIGFSKLFAATIGPDSLPLDSQLFEDLQQSLVFLFNEMQHSNIFRPGDPTTSSVTSLGIEHQVASDLNAVQQPIISYPVHTHQQETSSQETSSQNEINPPTISLREAIQQQPDSLSHSHNLSLCISSRDRLPECFLRNSWDHIDHPNGDVENSGKKNSFYLSYACTSY